MNRQQIQEMINWDCVDEKFTYAYVHKTGEHVHFWTHRKDYDDDNFEEIKRPIKLIDGAWYAFSFDNFMDACSRDDELVGQYNANAVVLYCNYKNYNPCDKGVTIHRQIPDDFWS